MSARVPGRILYFCKDFFQHYRKLDHRLLAERYEVTRFSYRHDPVSLAKLLAAVRRHDLVFAWFASPMSAFAVGAARAFGKKSLVVVGGYDVADYAPLRHGMAHRPIQKHFSRFALERADVAVPVSEFTRDELLRFARPRRYRVVPNAVDLPDVETPVERRRQVLTVGMVDSFYSQIKGHPAFLEVARRLPDVRFLLVGPFRDDSIDALRAEAPENVEFTGLVEHDRLLELYRESAVYLQLSRYESFSVPVAEAMWCGCTPIVSDTAALPEVVGDVGHRIDPDDLDSVVEVVGRALDSPRRDDAAARRARVFSVERRRDALYELIDELLAGADPGSSQ